MKYVLQAQDRGAKVIHVDPRYSRTSARADMFVRIRTGTDIAFMGGMIYLHPGGHAEEPREVQPASTCSSTPTRPTSSIRTSSCPAMTDRTVSSAAGTARSTTLATWKYANPANATAEAKLLTPNWEGWTSRTADDETAWGELDNNCVLKLLWRNYKRYDKATVSQITGIPVDKMEAVYAEYARTGATGKAGTIMYAMGATQHTYGSQNIRTYSIVQLLLGNIGCGGRRHQCAARHLQRAGFDRPGPAGAYPSRISQDDHRHRRSPDAGGLRLPTSPLQQTNPPADLGGDNPVNWWKNTPKYVHSLLKAWWPDVDLADSYNYLPKKKASGVNYTHMGLIQAIGEGKIDGLWIWGQNPAAGGPTSLGARDALKKLKWMVASDIWFNETHTFWKRPS